jgi:hypothetical protein
MASTLQNKVVETLQTANLLSDEIVFWRPFDQAPTVYYLRFLNDVACKINIKTNHDQNTVVRFLQTITLEELAQVNDKKPLVLSKTSSLSATPFKLRAIASPLVVSAGLSKNTTFLNGVTFTTFPAYECEFTLNDTRDEAAFRMAKVVRWSDWSRAPSPALSARFHRVRTGIKSTGGKRMGIFPIAVIEKTINHLAADDGFIDIENFERNVARIEHNEGTYQIIAGEKKWAPQSEAVIPWLQLFAIKGLSAATETR